MTNTAAGDSVTPWLKIDNTNNPRITWCEIRGGQPNQICYLGYDSTDARWELADGTQHNSNTLNAAVYQGSRPSLDLDRNIRPHIAFAGGYMRWNGSAWVNGLDNPITTNATDGTGSLNTYNAPFNPIDVRLLAVSEKVAISTGLMDAGGMQDVAYIQRAIPIPIAGTFEFSIIAATPMASLCNTAQFTHSHSDGTSESYSSNTVCNPMLEPAISKTSVKSEYMRDEDIEFDILVNNPSGPLTNCIVTDLIPAYLIFKSASVTPTTITPTQLTFNMGNMPTNSSFTIRVVFTLDPAYQFNNTPLTVINIASLTCTQFPTPRQDLASARIHKTAMLFVKTADKAKYKPSETVTYTIEIENLGTTPYNNVVVEDPIPSDLILESVNPDVGTVIDGTWSYFIGDLNPGDRHVLTLTLAINKDSVRNAVRNELSSFNIINTATLRADGFEPFISRAVITILLPKVTVQKFCKKFRMTPEETVTFTIIAKNISEVETTNTVLYDIFPNELIFSSAQPAGVAKPGKIVYDLGTFNPGETQKFDITFSVKHPEVWPETGIQIINTAILTCSELDDVMDHAVVVISPRRVTDPLQLVCKWINLDPKTNILSDNDLKLELNVVGGTSPYDYTIDWGDGTPKSLKTSVPESEIVKADHTFGSAGEYQITIKCVDRGARTKILERKITIK